MATQAQPAAQQAKANPNVVTGNGAAPLVKPTNQDAAPAGKAPEPAKPTKAPREATVVKMADGRDVEFVGKRKLLKESLIDDAARKVSVRLDFRNGKTILFACPESMLLKAAGHGLEQKLGDETAGTESVDDMYLEVEELTKRLTAGQWTTVREAGGFSGASVVIRAIAEVTGKTIEQVKEFLQKKLDAAEAKGEKLTRAALYNSFRAPNSKTAVVIERLEREARSGATAVNADDVLKELTA